MPRSLVGLGANLGERRQALEAAVERLAAQQGVAVVSVSGWRETAPIGGPPGQPPYLNGAVLLETAHSPQALHETLSTIERDLGRTRLGRWEPRLIDLDLLLYDQCVIETASLVVPHPRLAVRRFVLEGAAEVAPGMTHPLIGWSVRELLEHLDSAANYVALAGLPGSGKTALAARLARELGGRFIADPNPEPGGSSGSRYGQQIQFLDRRAGVLAADRCPNPKVLAISDFFWDQSLAYARCSLEQEEWEGFQAHWQATEKSVLQPKVVVALNVTRRTNATARGSAGSERLRCELGRLAARRGRGPAYHVVDRDPQAQFTEIAAVIRGMQ